MAVLPPLSTPTGAWRDLKAFLGARERHQLVFAGLAVAIPVLIVAGFYIDSDPGPREPVMIYVQDYNGVRPDAVIVAQQKVDQAEKDRVAAVRREAYRRLGEATGIN